MEYSLIKNFSTNASIGLLPRTALNLAFASYMECSYRSLEFCRILCSWWQLNWLLFGIFLQFFTRWFRTHTFYICFILQDFFLIYLFNWVFVYIICRFVFVYSRFFFEFFLLNVFQEIFEVYLLNFLRFSLFGLLLFLLFW